MIRTSQDFVASEPGHWIARALFRCEPDAMFGGNETWATVLWQAHQMRNIFGDSDDKYENMERWVAHVRDRFPVWSSGEKALVLAFLTAIDYAWLSDFLADGKTAEMLDEASDEYAEAVGACFARVD